MDMALSEHGRCQLAWHGMVRVNEPLVSVQAAHLSAALTAAMSANRPEAFWSTR